MKALVTTLTIASALVVILGLSALFAALGVNLGGLSALAALTPIGSGVILLFGLALFTVGVIWLCVKYKQNRVQEEQREHNDIVEQKEREGVDATWVALLRDLRPRRLEPTTAVEGTEEFNRFLEETADTDEGRVFLKATRLCMMAPYLRRGIERVQGEVDYEALSVGEETIVDQLTILLGFLFAYEAELGTFGASFLDPISSYQSYYELKIDCKAVDERLRTFRQNTNQPINRLINATLEKIRSVKNQTSGGSEESQIVDMLHKFIVNIFNNIDRNLGTIVMRFVSEFRPEDDSDESDD